MARALRTPQSSFEHSDGQDRSCLVPMNGGGGKVEAPLPTLACRLVDATDVALAVQDAELIFSEFSLNGELHWADRLS
jgi:hypothetical protein